jgi:hypothetical protein
MGAFAEPVHQDNQRAGLRSSAKCSNLREKGPLKFSLDIPLPIVLIDEPVLQWKRRFQLLKPARGQG